MYLPPGLAVTLLRLLQAPLTLLNFDLPTLRSVAIDGDYYRGKHLDDLGSPSGHQNAPTVSRVPADLPDDCTVEQVTLLHTHDPRNPLKAQEYILKFANTLDRAQDIFQATDLPPDLDFLEEGYKYRLLRKELALIRRKELFDHGVKFALHYPAFSTDVVVSTTDEGARDSAYFFSQGFFGREARNVTFLTTEDFEDPVSWLVPWKLCPKLSEPSQGAEGWAEKYIPPVMERLDKLIPGVELSFNDVRGALYACAYDIAAGHRSPWCNVFTAHELRDLEHELDLFLNSHNGRTFSGDPRLHLGGFYIKKLIERFTDTKRNVRPLYLEFSHEYYSIRLPLSAMGLHNPDHLSSHCGVRGSYQSPSAAELVWEKFTCNQTFRGPQVRLILNGATFPLSICAQTEDDKKYGTCSLDAFVRENEYSMRVEYGSKIWNATRECGR